eukprot:4257664-Prymnesium_polylepis.1
MGTWKDTSLYYCEGNGARDGYPCCVGDRHTVTFTQGSLEKKQAYPSQLNQLRACLLYTSPSPRDAHES